MLALADAENAKLLREQFASRLVIDIGKIVTYAGARNLLTSREESLLGAALVSIAARQEEQPVRSELFWAYFRALAVLTTVPMGQLARDSVLSIGNALLEPIARHRIDRPVPVMTQRNGWVSVPSACVTEHLLFSVPHTVVHPEVLSDNRTALMGATDASWIANSKGALGVRRITFPVAAEVERYAHEARRLEGRPAETGSGGLFELSVARPHGAVIVDRLQDAFALVRSVDADYGGELSALTEYVVPLEGQSSFVGGSALSLYGASVLKLRTEWSTLCFADHLVHESAHQLLHASQELEPLLLNRDHMGGASPIRSDPRPLYGSFHATFVFLRLTQFMARALSRLPDSPLRTEVGIRFQRHFLGLLRGLDVVSSLGVFSAKGREELAEWKDIAADLRLQHGDPDPAVASKLNWDYEPPPSSP